MIAAAVSLSFQKWIGFHRWRVLHATVCASYTAMTVHILVSGSEAGFAWVQVVVVAPWATAMVPWLKGAGDGARGFAGRLVRSRAKTTSVQVDPVRCVRFGFCEQEAPDCFTLRVTADWRTTRARAIAVARAGAVGDPRVIPLRVAASADTTNRSGACGRPGSNYSQTHRRRH